MTFAFDPPLRAPTTVVEGGTFVVDTAAGVKEVTIAIPGAGTWRVRVVNRRVEFRVSPGVAGGTPIFVGDATKPVPFTTTIMVVGST